MFAGYAKALAFTRLKTVVEPGGAVPLAATLFDEDKISDGDVLVLASGGNLDPELFALGPRLIRRLRCRALRLLRS